MKSGKLLILLSMLALALGVLTATAYAAPPRPDTDPRPVKPEAPAAALDAGIMSIGTSTVNWANPTMIPPGSTVDLCFNLTMGSPDAEYLDHFDADLPDGWTVNSLADIPGTGCGLGHNSGVAAGNVIYWQTNGYPPQTLCGDWQNGTYNFCANVTVPNCSGAPWSLPWNIIGDGYGGTPHSTAGTVGPVDCAQPPYEWAKYINGQPWTPGIAITVQTSDTLQVTEIVTTNLPFNLVENWNPAHLRLLDYQVSPGGIVITNTGYLEWHQPPGLPQPAFLTKWFHVEPCTWLNTVLDEVLFVEGLPPEPRPVLINKLPPQLWIDALYQPPVTAGMPADFTLQYGNDGGYENAVMVRNDFPPTAPFLYSTPPPSRQDPGGLWVEWDVGDLPQGAMGNIDVTVMIQPGLPPSTTISIVDIIYDHVRVERAWVVIGFHVVPIQISWDKTIDGIPWQPGMQITRQTSDTIVVQEVLHLNQPPLKAAATPVLAPSGLAPKLPVELTAQPTLPLTKKLPPRSGVASPPRNPDAVLWDQPTDYTNGGVADWFPPEGWGAFSADDFQNAAAWNIDTIYVPGWQYLGSMYNAAALHWCIYPDAGGVPAGYPFVGGEYWCWSTAPTNPAVTIGGTYGGDVTLDVIAGLGAPLPLPPGAWWLVFYPEFASSSADWYYWFFGTTTNGYPAQLIDPMNHFGVGATSWTPWPSLGGYYDMAFRLEGTAEQGPVVAQIETWDPTRMTLLDWAATGGQVIVDPAGRLEWTDTVVAPTTITLIKWFHVEPCTWPDTVLWEELWLDQTELEQRPVVINHLLPDLWIDAAYEPGVLSGFPVNFTLQYGNTGGYENQFGIYNNFPPEAPFVSSVPPPTYVSPDGLYAQWDLGALPQGAQGNIDVTVQIQTGLQPSTTIEIWDYIFDHTLEVRDAVLITFHVEQPFEWIKLVNGVPWDPAMVVTVQTSDTIVVQDTVASPLDYHLVENWNPAHLQLTNWVADCGTVIVEPGHLEWFVIPGMPPCTLTKWFHIEPCTWTDTTLDEVLFVDNLEPVFRPVPIHKLPSALWIDAAYQSGVLSGFPANFTLQYGNTGGYENAAGIYNNFPPEAPFVSSVPPPIYVSPDHLYAQWDLGALPQGAQGTIDVTVMIQPGLPVSTTIEIWDYIGDHTLEVRDAVLITFHVNPAFDWTKLVNGVPWDPAMVVTAQTSDTIVIQETVASPLDYHLVENWNPAHLQLVNWVADCGTVIVEPGHSEWFVIPGMPPCTLTKWFHVEPCTWTDTVLDEVLVVDNLEPVFRPVPIHKLPSALWIDAAYQSGVLSGFPANFTLQYGNTGGYENAAGIYNNFPPEAPFVSSVPPPIYVSPDHLYAQWDLGALPQGAQGTIDVTVMIQPGLPVSTTIEIWDYIGDHTLVVRDSVLITFHVDPAFDWTKLVNGVPWDPAMVVTVQTSDTIVITDSVASPLDYHLMENWNTAHLVLTDWAATGGDVIVQPGHLEWHVLPGMPPYTLTKRFHVEPCTWTDTVLDEVLVVDNLEPVFRPVPIHKLPSALWIDAVGGGPVLAGQEANFALLFGNQGGFDNDVLIRNTFPPEAPFVRSDPPPSRVDPAGLWAEWDIAGLPMGAQDHISLTVQIQPSLPPSTTIDIWDGIFDHTGTLVDWVIITFHVEQPPLTVEWEKYIDGVPWQPGMDITRQTSDTIEVVEVMHVVPGLPLTGWKPAGPVPPEGGWLPGPALDLVTAESQPAPPVMSGATWAIPEAVLWDNGPLVTHAGICSGQDASRLQTDLLMNTLGFGHQFSVGNRMADDFSITDPGGWQIDTITFFAYQTGAPTTPSPITGVYYQIWNGPPNDPGSSVVFGDLVTNRLLSSTFTNIQRDSGTAPCANNRYIFADVTSAGTNLPPGTYWIDWMTDGSLASGPWAPPVTILGQTTTGNGLQYTTSSGAWGPANDTGTLTQQGLPFVIEGTAVVPTFAQIETWDPTKLRLLDWAATGGQVIVEPDRVEWTGELIEPATITLTKWFHVEPCTWDVTTLWEELWLDGVELEQRPVIIHKLPPALWIDAVGGGDVFPGQVVSFTLLFGNQGGFENDVLIRNDFPPGANFANAYPYPNRWDPGGLWAEWDIAGLPQGAPGSIEVAVLIAPTVPPSTTFDIVDYIFDHVQHEWDRVTITFHAITPYRYIYLPVVFKNYVSGP